MLAPIIKKNNNIMETFENTTLWKNSLGIKNDSQFNDKIEKLRTAFFSLRENTSHLVTRISAELPGLTQHEITHLDSLWDTASLITGENYPINPLEGFILGSAILIHDSALCFEAYENGKIGLRETLQWKDAYAESQDENAADFIALRELHAKQAENLLHKSWADPDGKSTLYLLENQTLRKHFGKLIGQIASSHHWDIESLTQNLSIQQNTLPEYPREWRIDPIKLACIIRCADAAHIDNLRAPDFLHALLKRNGISLNHWLAQNKLAKVDLDMLDSEKETLLFTSTIDFPEEEADSWFVVYDAICIVDKEIKSCNSLLHNRDSNLVFKIKNVKGIASPEKLASYIKVNNWKPCSAQVHVGNVERLIQNLGGEMLYGSGNDLLGVVIRELIQNSRDSIKARLYVDNSFEGKIKINIEVIENDTWLTIEDNGIGMSERVLTGPLLDFGTSFWTSNLIKSEFPGLRSSGFKSIGKFGIGFYSVFMIATQVYVASRNWNEGLSETHLLKFEKGLTLRPILKKGKLDRFQSSVSTQVRIKVKQGLISEDLMMEIKTNRMGSTNFYVPFSKYLSALCSGLDVSLYYSENNKSEIKIHEHLESTNFKVQEWLKDISFAEYRNDHDVNNYISQNSHRLRPICENGQLYGLAAISTFVNRNQDFLSISTVGGLANSVHSRDGERYIGFIDYLPNSAKREIGKYAVSEQVINDWAVSQLEELQKTNLNQIECYHASSALCHFKVDPRPIAQILVSINKNQSFMKFENLADLSITVGIAFIESGLGSGEHMETHHNIIDLPGFALIRPLNNSSFLSLKLDDKKEPDNNFSILSCLWKSCLEKGYNPRLEKVNNIGQNNFNQNINAIILKSNK